MTAIEHQAIRFVDDFDDRQIASKNCRQGGILAKYLLGGMGVDVETVAGTPVKGQVTTGSLAPTKRMVWLPREVGSGLPGHWVEEGSSRSVAGVNAGIIRIDTIRKMQDHNDASH